MIWFKPFENIFTGFVDKVGFKVILILASTFFYNSFFIFFNFAFCPEKSSGHLSGLQPLTPIHPHRCCLL